METESRDIFYLLLIELGIEPNSKLAKLVPEVSRMERQVNFYSLHQCYDRSLVAGEELDIFKLTLHEITRKFFVSSQFYREIYEIIWNFLQQTHHQKLFPDSNSHSHVKAKVLALVDNVHYIAQRISACVTNAGGEPKHFQPTRLGLTHFAATVC